MFLALAVLLTQPLAIPQAVTPQAGQHSPVVQVAAANIPESNSGWLATLKPAPVTNSNTATVNANPSANAGENPPAAPVQPSAEADAGAAELPFLLPGSSSTDLPFTPPAASFAPVPVAKMSPFMIRRSEVRPPKTWYALTAANHAAATFDAWSTRRVVSSGAGRELNPLLRPFAGSNGLYAAIQVGPGLLDLLGKRMAHSPRPWVRKMWWVPQVVGTAGSLWSGAHNVHVYRQATAGLPTQ